MVALTLQEMTPSMSEHFISWLLRKGFTATVWIVAEGLTGLELHDDREAKHRGAAIRPSGQHRTLAAASDPCCTMCRPASHTLPPDFSTPRGYADGNCHTCHALS